MPVTDPNSIRRAVEQFQRRRRAFEHQLASPPVATRNGLGLARANRRATDRRCHESEGAGFEEAVCFRIDSPLSSIRYAL